MTGPLETVKKALQAYVDKDRALIDSVIGRPYSFTSRSTTRSVAKSILNAAGCQ
ncbi:hypothetical protein [Mesorhizobium sophorae]|uniref:hypothetical protein n=1 Tax=Mesorhizobium sophorae TaxID=1300294 RepID=UPI00142DF7EC|nr:hypothetical protein [Mesorhizobium sophorae]